MDNMQTPPAASAPRKVTMLFAVVATGAVASTAVVPDEPDAPLEGITEARRPERVEPPPPPQRIVDRPLVLRSGAPACGNTMGKAATPVRCRPINRPQLFQKLNLDVTIKVNASTGKPEPR